MNPIEGLIEEHNLLRLFLGAYEKHIEDSLGTGHLNLFTSKILLNDLKLYVESAHMLKENRHLRPRLIAAGVSKDYGPLVLLEEEHNRIHLEMNNLFDVFDLVNEGNKSMKLKYIHLVLYTITLLRLQMFKEEKCIYPLARELFSPLDLDALQEAFVQEDRAYERKAITIHGEQIQSIGNCFGLTLQDGKVIQKPLWKAPTAESLC